MWTIDAVSSDTAFKMLRSGASLGKYDKKGKIRSRFVCISADLTMLQWAPERSSAVWERQVLAKNIKEITKGLKQQKGALSLSLWSFARMTSGRSRHREALY